MRSETIWKLSDRSQSWPETVLVEIIYPPLSIDLVSFDYHDEGSMEIPVKILCGHDCNLCAPPTASSVFCPGFNPLHNTRSASRRPTRDQNHILPRPACDCDLREKFRLQVICIVQTQPAPRLLKLLRRQALERSLRGHGHEYGQRHGAMWEVQRRCSRAGRLVK